MPESVAEFGRDAMRSTLSMRAGQQSYDIVSDGADRHGSLQWIVSWQVRDAGLFVEWDVADLGPVLAVEAWAAVARSDIGTLRQLVGARELRNPYVLDPPFSFGPEPQWWVEEVNLSASRELLGRAFTRAESLAAFET